MIMAITEMLLSFIAFAGCCHLSAAMTDKIRLLACDNVERRIIAAHITTGNVRGKLECYFAPQNTQSIFRLYISKLNLERRSGGCPSVKFIGYTTKMLLPEVNEDWIRADRRIEIPSDPITLVEYDCTNYQKATGKILESSKTGQKLVVEFDTKNIKTDRDGDVNFVVSSYVSGPSYNCPAETFRCWKTKHVCIPASLECDGVDNCYDNSDEDNFKCTRKIAGMLLPLFIVVIILILLLVIAAIIVFVLCMRRRRHRRQKLEETRREAMNYHGMNSPYYITNSRQSLPYLSPETTNSKTNLA